MKFLAIIAAIVLAKVVVLGGSQPALYDIPLKDINHDDTSLKAYKGKVVLLVNVASRCGFTPQYEGLLALHEKYKDKGFTVLGAPSNDFGGQEPGSNEEIKKFCTTKYNVTFPLTDKVKVKGPEQHPLYAALTGKEAAFPGDVKWNFGKFLIGKDGKVIARFDSKVAPDSKELVEAIEAALAK